jgi:hypothetical protein
MSAPSTAALLVNAHVVTVIVAPPPVLPSPVFIDRAPPFPDDVAVFPSKVQLVIVAEDPRPSYIAPP